MLGIGEWRVQVLQQEPGGSWPQGEGADLAGQEWEWVAEHVMFTSVLGSLWLSA
jgi:hypothetical protein